MSRYGKFIDCPAGRWTVIYEAPNWGGISIWSDRTTSVRWRRFSDTPPWYWGGRTVLETGNNDSGFGYPSHYLRVEVRPDADFIVRVF